MVNNYHLASKGVRVMKVMTLPTVSSTDEGSLYSELQGGDTLIYPVLRSSSLIKVLTC